MAMKEYSAFPKAPGQKPHHQMVLCHNQNIRWGVVLSLSKEAVYCTAPNSSIWPIDGTLSHRFRVELGVMAMKEYSAFPKAPGQKPHHQMVLYHNQDIRWGVILSLSKEAVYCTAPNSSIWPIDGTLSHRFRVELGVMAVKEYSAFPKAPGQKPHHQMVQCHNHDIRCGVVLSLGKEAVYCTAPTNWSSHFSFSI